MAQDIQEFKPIFSSKIADQSCTSDPSLPQPCLKPDSSHQSLQIDCRANHTKPNIYHAYPMDVPVPTPDQPDTLEAAKPQDRISRDSGDEGAQDPTSSHESSRPLECLSPGVGPTFDKKCSQCGATKTPMWRNDTNGNKTLCNACGVRLQRQINKQKQQSQALADNSTSLIAGKLPRSRTSPAKLSRQDLSRSCSQEAFRPGEVHKGTLGRSLTLIQNSGGQPTLTIAQGPKRKGLDAVTTFSSPTEAERKRLCNELGEAWAVTGNPMAEPGLPTDLLIPNGRAPNCIARLELMGLGGSRPFGGRLRVYCASGKLAASSSSPGSEETLRYSLDHQAWLWSASPQWSLLFTAKETAARFEDLLRRWRASRHADLGFGWGFSGYPTIQVPHNVLPTTAGLATEATLPPRQGMEADDRKFLDRINAKIREEANSSSNTSNPKALNATLAEATFQRLISTFEYFLQRTQGFSEANVCQLSVNLDWTPNRAVILAVHRYWIGKLYRTGRAADFHRATSGGGSHPAAISRSFSASPPVLSGKSDMSAMTLEDLALSQGGGGGICEETSDNMPTQSAFASEGANLGAGVMTYNQKAPDFSLPTMHGLNESGGSLSTSFAPQPWMTNASFNSPVANSLPPGLPEEWDPLDPSNLARIADPNQAVSFETQKSTTLAGLEDRSPLQERCSLPLLGSASSAVVPQGSTPGVALEPLGTGFLQPVVPLDQPMVGLPELPGMVQPGPGSSENATPMGPTLDLPCSNLRSNSGVDLSSLRQQLYSSSFSNIDETQMGSFHLQQRMHSSSAHDVPNTDDSHAAGHKLPE